MTSQNQKPTPADSFKKLLASELFAVHVGKKNGKPAVFRVHAEAISDQSPALKTMIYGEFAENASKSVAFEDVDEDTFARFLQFAYRGEYQPPPSEVEDNDTVKRDFKVDADQRTDTGLTVLSAIADEDFATNGTETSPGYDPWAPSREANSSEDYRKTKLSKRAMSSAAFEARKYPAAESLEALIQMCKPVANTGPNESFLAVFLGHAKLYVFADMYDVVPLKHLAFNKLHQTLLTFTPYAQRVGDVVELVRYVYENTMGAEHRVDELRALVVHYVVPQMDVISDTKEFYGLIERGGDFVRDFWRAVKKDVLCGNAVD